MAKREKGMLPWLYTTAPGRGVLKLLTARPVSKAAGAFCESRLSKPLIRPFVKGNGINLQEYEKQEFSSFNDCFTRKIKSELRPVCMDGSALISPSDGLLSAYKIEKGMVFPAKQSAYSVASLLCVQHYHRYCYLDSGTKGENIFIPGVLHTVQPIALEHHAVFCENCREYTVMDTENFGKVIQCEIGAMLVGRIQNHHGPGKMKRGDEKGMFLYGGSTIVVLLQPGAATLPASYFEATARGEETPVKFGQQIGRKAE